MELAIIILLILVCLIEFGLLLLQLRKITDNEISLDYYRSRIRRMIENDSLVSESKEIICGAYGIELGDLNNAIVEIQKKGDAYEP